MAHADPSDAPTATVVPARGGVVWLKRGMIAAWALWLSVVWLTNVLDALKAMGVLDAGWRLASGNYALVEKAMELYLLPGGLVALTFLGVIIWEGGAAALLWWAAARFRGAAPYGLGPVYVAFAALIGLWFAFMVMDEVFLQYAIEGAHRQLLIGSIATLLAVVLLPE
jgi:hypothetical protein